ncbi:MAG: hypothetical protein WBS20_07300, partial [Lysobacterales bacterium]
LLGVQPLPTRKRKAAGPRLQAAGSRAIKNQARGQYEYIAKPGRGQKQASQECRKKSEQEKVTAENHYGPVAESRCEFKRLSAAITPPGLNLLQIDPAPRRVDDRRISSSPGCYYPEHGSMAVAAVIMPP